MKLNKKFKKELRKLSKSLPVIALKKYDYDIIDYKSINKQGFDEKLKYPFFKEKDEFIYITDKTHYETLIDIFDRCKTEKEFKNGAKAYISRVKVTLKNSIANYPEEYIL